MNLSSTLSTSHLSSLIRFQSSHLHPCVTLSLPTPTPFNNRLPLISILALTIATIMAEAFLALLPKVGRGVLSKEDQRCTICMEEYGTTPSNNGIIERAVRLPCNHVVGSECISIWLTPTPGQQNHNTCHVCRYEFFPISDPPQPRPRTTPWWTEHMRIHTELGQHIDTLGQQLDLDADINELGLYVANRLHDRDLVGEHSLVAVAAASVYMAGHLLGHERSVRTISHGVALGGLGNSSAEAIQEVYVLLYQYRRRLVDWELLTHVLGATMAVGQVDEAPISPQS